MYPQHERATQNLVALFKEDPEVLAVILAGSLAKGLERPDSDVDAIIAVTEEKYRRLQMEGRTSECIEEGCGYEGGYFDLKYYTKDYLLAAAAHGQRAYPLRVYRLVLPVFPRRGAAGDCRAYPGFSESGEGGEDAVVLRGAPPLQRLFLGLLQAGKPLSASEIGGYDRIVRAAPGAGGCRRAVSVPEKPDEGCRCPAGGKEAGREL